LRKRFRVKFFYTITFRLKHCSAMSQINIKQIAKNLNLAISTVSKALNDSYEISQETKNRVNQYAQQFNYKPNPYASSLRQQKSKTIAVVIPEVADSFFHLQLTGLKQLPDRKVIMY